LPDAGSDTGVIQGEPLTARERAIWEAGREAAKNTVPTLNDMLGKLVTLDTALIGGGLVVAKGETLPFWVAVAVLVLLLVSLGAALSGLWPRRAVLNLGDLEQIEAFDREVIHRKTDALTCAGIAFAAAVTLAVLGLIGRGVFVAFTHS
jgi:hypothetical protein